MLLGCIADDFTGATDLANTLARNGMKVVQTIGVQKQLKVEAEAVVVALKSRTIPADEAVRQSVAACRWLSARGARQIYFKYCSTFDSTDQGNIGPVADALLAELNADLTIACPAFPETGRTVYQGHLFVGETLLSDSGMRQHPLTPMTDSNLVRVLGRQTPNPVSLIPYRDVNRGAPAIHAAIAAAREVGIRHLIVDAVMNDDLLSLGEAVQDLKLVTGGSGAAMGLPANFRAAGLLESRDRVAPLAPVEGRIVVLSGSCSTATLGQVTAMKKHHPAFAIDPLAIAEDFQGYVSRVVDWADKHGSVAPLIYATADPETVVAVQRRLGKDAAGRLVEEAFASIASRMAEKNVRRFVVAGGETSGAVVGALAVPALEIGPQIAPGVPATRSIGREGTQLGLVLKSGNFGGADFFAQALEALK
jgi:uncharacterized protein YgbK (DUF1537 family)